MDTATEIPQMNEFAQTRGADDLFDDEIIPVPAEEQVIEEHAQSDFQPQDEALEERLEKLEIETQTSPAETPQRPRKGERGKGRGRGRGGRGGRISQGSNAPERPDSGARSKLTENASEEIAKSFEGLEAQDKTTEGAGSSLVNDEDACATAENGPDMPRVPAVRGDRSATGGVKKVLSHTVSLMSQIKEVDCS